MSFLQAVMILSTQKSSAKNNALRANWGYFIERQAYFSFSFRKYPIALASR